MPPVRPARLEVLHRRPVQRLVAAGAIVGLASALATIEALAAESDEPDEAETVRIAASDEVQLVADDEPELSTAIRQALDDREELVAAEAEAAEAAADPERDPDPEPAPEPEPEEDPEPEHEGAVDLATWERLAECESGGNWSINTGNGFYGGLQFEVSSWEWVGGTGYPHEASKQEQIDRAEMLYERQGWGAWPACSRQLGLR